MTIEEEALFRGLIDEVQSIRRELVKTNQLLLQLAERESAAEIAQRIFRRGAVGVTL